MIIDGKSILRTFNTRPTNYENVKVWAAQGKYYPVANARIKDFEYEQKGKLIYNTIEVGYHAMPHIHLFYCLALLECHALLKWLA